MSAKGKAEMEIPESHGAVSSDGISGFYGITALFTVSELAKNINDYFWYRRTVSDRSFGDKLQRGA